MPARLPLPDEKVTWRMFAEDLDLLRGLSCNVNDVARELLHSYCQRLRAKLEGQHVQPISTSQSTSRNST